MSRLGALGLLTVGDITIHWLRGGRFRLDGGAMFGPVPKPLWARRFPCDERNSIPMQAYPLLVTTPEHRLLIDTGLGNKLNTKQRRNFLVEEEWAIDDDLAALGLTANDIDIVILTHLDWDHASGGTRRTGGHSAPEGDDSIVPTFGRARYVVQQREWEAALNPTSRTQHGYWRENWAPLRDAGQVELVDGDVEIVPGVRLYLTGGHTHGHQIVHIESAGETLLHLADILPTHAHINPLWVMGYDNFPLTSIAEKERWLPQAQADGWWLSFYHDPFLLAATVGRDGRVERHVAGGLGWPPAVSNTG